MNKQAVVVTPGRFGSFDLAEQLQKADRLATIFTGYPRFKLRDTRVDPRLIRTYPWLQVPYQAMWRFGFFPKGLLRELTWRTVDAIDAHAARNLPECGLVAGLSASGLRTGTVIRKRGGAYVCDRGSTHILYQKRLLDEEYDRLGWAWEGIDQRVIDKELAEYELADGITLGSSFTIRSFEEFGVPSRKLILAPYGVDLSKFRRTQPRAGNFRILFAGLPIVRKGVQYLLEAFHRAKLPGAELVFVGPTSPEWDELRRRYPSEGVIVRGFIPRDEVIDEFSRASVMVLPSIEEGLAKVQAQAMACGTPVIATPNCGAEDLFTDGQEGFIIPPRDVDALVERLTRLYRDPELLQAMSEASTRRVRALGSWDDYGRIILAAYDKLLAARGIT
jgi:glycosyltransferase involved in cell wall biosynthesis